MQSYESFVIVARSLQCDQAQRHAAFAQLVAQFRAMALTQAYQVLGDAHLAQDVTQEAFLTAYQRLAQLREPAAFPGWLRLIVHTHCSRLTRGKRLESLPLECLETIPQTNGDPAQLLVDEEAAQLLVECIMSEIAELPAHERAVVRLFYFDGYAIREVAQALDLPITTVKKRLQYARDRLRKRLMDSFKQGGMIMETWLIQAGQWLLPLLAVATAEPALCPIVVTPRRLPNNVPTQAVWR